MEKEVSEAERRLVIKRTYSEKINLLIKQDISEKELYSIIRHFFSDFLKLEYEFTYEELSQELNKVFIKQALKQRIDKMLDELSWFEYMPDHDLSLVEKKKLLNDFNEMVDQLILDFEEKPGKSSFFDKLFGKKKEDKSVDTPLITTTPSNIDVQQEQFSNIIIDSAQQKNGDMVQKIRKEIVQKEDRNPNFNYFTSGNINNSNNLLMSTEKEDGFSNTQKTMRKDSQIIPSIPMNEIPPLSKELFNQISVSASKSLPSSKPLHSSKTVENKVPDNDNIHNGANTYYTKNNNADSIKKSPSILIEDNDPLIVKIKELIEESYNFLSLGAIDNARIKYMDALSVYNKFDYAKKTKTYIEVYDLYKKLK